MAYPKFKVHGVPVVAPRQHQRKMRDYILRSIREEGDSVKRPPQAVLRRRVQTALRKLQGGFVDSPIRETPQASGHQPLAEQTRHHDGSNGGQTGGPLGSSNLLHPKPMDGVVLLPQPLAGPSPEETQHQKAHGGLLDGTADALPVEKSGSPPGPPATLSYPENLAGHEHAGMCPMKHSGEPAVPTAQKQIPCRSGNDQPLVLDISPRAFLANPWRIHKELGHGAFAHVYAAMWQGEMRALKYQHIDPLRPFEEQPVHQEVQALRTFAECPGIINCLKVLVTPFNVQFLLELFDMDLGAFIQKKPQPMKEADAKMISRCVVSGLQHMHSRCFVHRDLKPANILVKSQPLAAVIADLGAAMLGEGSKEHVTTLIYRAPELLLGMGYTFASDIWSLGLICMELESKEALSQWVARGEDWNEEVPALLFFARLVGKLCGMDFTGMMNPTLMWQGFRPYVNPAILQLHIETGEKRGFGKRFQSASFVTFLSSLLRFRACDRTMAKHLSVLTWLLPADCEKKHTSSNILEHPQTSLPCPDILQNG